MGATEKEDLLMRTGPYLGSDIKLDYRLALQMEASGSYYRFLIGNESVPIPITHLLF